MQRPLLTLLLLLFFVACGAREQDDPLQHEWLSVLELKRAAVSSPLNSPERQRYIDALARFVRTHPDHGRARAVYADAELDFARALTARGLYEEAIPYYRDLLKTHDDPSAIRHELDDAMNRRYVDVAKFLDVKPGMTQSAVESLLGKPAPGWSKSLQNASGKQDAWFYKRADGGIAGVYFSGGKVLTTELATSGEKEQKPQNRTGS